jgi:putative DNA modification/repair radical SAM protein
METLDKLELLGQSAQHDLSCGMCGSDSHRVRDEIGRWIYPAAMPDGKRVKLLKVLLTNVCENDCFYCACRSSRDIRRVAFQPEELARAFDDMVTRRRVEGLFLSSAVCGRSNIAMDRMIAAVELVRHHYHFQGYVHLKILPGSTDAHIERAMHLADRVSVNLEAPNPDRLARIAPGKDLVRGLLEPMRQAARLSEESGGRLAPSGQTTQLVVGASGESDAEIMRTVDWLYRKLSLARVYYSAFQPVEGTPLEDVPATPPLREHRLYQSDVLLRQYGWPLADLEFAPDGNLPLEGDPKWVWATRHPERFPVEVNCASREELLRVPGMGLSSVERLLQKRRLGAIRSLRDLARMGTVTDRAAPFVLLDGKAAERQLRLFV